MWRFRYSLTSEARALTKFLKCVDWGDAQEARQAADLMQAWAPIAIADALELLSPDFSNEQVRLPSAVALCSFCCLPFGPFGNL
jgi:phosphatidylinositol 3-kinase